MVVLAGLFVLAACGANESPITPQDMANAEDAMFISVGDFSHLRTPYVGAAHATHSVVNALPLPDENWLIVLIQIGQDHGDFAESYSPYTLTIFYEPREGSVISGTRDDLEIPTDAFIANSDLLFDLIENLQAVTFSIKLNPVESGEADSDFFDYRWSRSRHGEYSLQMQTL